MSKQQIAEAFQRYRSAPDAFVREMFGINPEPWQTAVLRDVAAPGAHVAVKAGHGVGKSALDSWVIIWFMLTHYPTKIPCTAPTGHQLEDVLWSELGKWVRRLPKYLQDQLNFKSERLELTAAPLESFAVARTSRTDKPEALQGFHSDNLLFILDEASGIEDVIFEVAQGSLSTPGARILMTANPTRTSGYFYDAFNVMRTRWKCHTVSCFDSSQVAKNYPDDVALKYGRDSSVYRVRVLGEFPLAEDDVLIPLHLCEAALTSEVEPSDVYKPIWGLDVARFGDDRCALAKRRGNAMLEPVKAWEGQDTMQTVGHVVREYKDAVFNGLEPSTICVDVIGIGSGVADRLHEMGLPVTCVNVGESARDDRYMRLRDELWWKAREWLESHNCRLVDDDALIAELTDVKYKLESTGKLRVEPKDDLKKRGLRSPDLADAFVLTFAGPLELSYKRKRYDQKKTHQTNWEAA